MQKKSRKKNKSKRPLNVSKLFIYGAILVSAQILSYYHHATHPTPSIDGASKHPATVEVVEAPRRLSTDLIGQGVFAGVLVLGLMFLVSGASVNEFKRKLLSIKTKQPIYGQKLLKLSQQAVDLNVSPTVAWNCLREAANGLNVKAIDTRRTAWILNETDDSARTIKCSLNYISDPIGRKLSAIYPRLIKMETSIEAYGSITRMRTRYTFPTPMNLETVSQITNQTSAKLVEFIVNADAARSEEIKSSSLETQLAHQI
ncbi:MAG: hypothetical protein IAF58_06060 [Leptolyngbya sp.]|nr:hypothetical protein [Candidatus Melainabacteria bacterium]